MEIYFSMSYEIIFLSYEYADGEVRNLFFIFYFLFFLSYEYASDDDDDVCNLFFYGEEFFFYE